MQSRTGVETQLHPVFLGTQASPAHPFAFRRWTFDSTVQDSNIPILGSRMEAGNEEIKSKNHLQVFPNEDD